MMLQLYNSMDFLVFQAISIMVIFTSHDVSSVDFLWNLALINYRLSLQLTLYIRQLYRPIFQPP